ncbi:MAG: hypothetical protein QOI92_2301 [Chloroflexota bacterium]|jgi:hypothetical protein|nr:hypothetical protein [Chloroflexota bacterium]
MTFSPVRDSQSRHRIGLQTRPGAAALETRVRDIGPI